ncbi:MAG: tetratricopeptide repeat protein, partial [Phycisphaerae bacterium]|nr:tetratricopeptide repeat protein [Phycisphaerae bacterium]
QQHQMLRILMTALVSMERQDEALGVAEKIYKLDPDDSGINNDLGYFWADRGINLDKAEAMIRKALAARPDELAFKDSFAWVLYKQGRFAEARTVFDDVLSAEEGRHQVMLDHAGDTCWRLGLKAEAIRLWVRAVKEAKKEKNPGIDTKKVLEATPRKIKAARKGGKPPVAPLGKGVGGTGL